MTSNLSNSVPTLGTISRQSRSNGPGQQRSDLTQSLTANLNAPNDILQPIAVNNASKDPRVDLERKWMRSRLMVIGDGRVGKTSLVQRMMGKKFDLEVLSTRGAEIKDISTLGVKVNEVNSDFMISTKSEQIRTRRQYLAEKITTETATGDNSSAPSPSKRAKHAVDMGEMSLSYNNITRGEADALTFSLWDYGGQSVFRTIHHILLSRRGVYILVFSMHAFLHDERNCMAVMHYWIRELEANAKGAPVFIVGTHRDRIAGRSVREVNQTIEMISRKLKQDEFLQSYENLQDYDEVNELTGENKSLAFFPVDNTSEKVSCVILDLKKLIEEAARNDPYMGEMSGQGGSSCSSSIGYVNEYVDCRIFAVCDELRMMKYQGCHYLCRDEFITVLKRCKLIDPSTDQPPEISVVVVESCARKLHELGIVIAFDIPILQDYIVLDPQWLIDKMACVIRDFALHRLERDSIIQEKQYHAFDRYVHCGILTKDMLPLLWQLHKEKSNVGDFLLQMMESLKLMCTIPTSPDELYVPSVVLYGKRRTTADAHSGDQVELEGSEVDLPLHSGTKSAVELLPSGTNISLLDQCMQFEERVNVHFQRIESLTIAFADERIIPHGFFPRLLVELVSRQAVTCTVRFPSVLCTVFDCLPKGIPGFISMQAGHVFVLSVCNELVLLRGSADSTSIEVLLCLIERSSTTDIAYSLKDAWRTISSVFYNDSSDPIVERYPPDDVSATVTDFKMPVDSSIPATVTDFKMPVDSSIPATVTDFKMLVDSSIPATVTDFKMPVDSLIPATATDFKMPVDSSIPATVMDFKMPMDSSKHVSCDDDVTFIKQIYRGGGGGVTSAAAATAAADGLLDTSSIEAGDSQAFQEWMCYLKQLFSKQRVDESILRTYAEQLLNEKGCSLDTLRNSFQQGRVKTATENDLFEKFVFGHRECIINALKDSDLMHTKKEDAREAVHTDSRTDLRLSVLGFFVAKDATAVQWEQHQIQIECIRGNFNFRSFLKPTKESFVKMLSNREVAKEIVHYAGHGEEAGVMWYASSDMHRDDTRSMDTEEFVAILRNEDSSIQCIFLNACDQRVVAELLSTHFVLICWKGKVSDTISAKFAKLFYNKLVAFRKDEQPYRKAFQHAHKELAEYWSTMPVTRTQPVDASDPPIFFDKGGQVIDDGWWVFNDHDDDEAGNVDSDAVPVAQLLNAEQAALQCLGFPDGTVSQEILKQWHDQYGSTSTAADGRYSYTVGVLRPDGVLERQVTHLIEHGAYPRIAWAVRQFGSVGAPQSTSTITMRNWLSSCVYGFYEREAFECLGLANVDSIKVGNGMNERGFLWDSVLAPWFHECGLSPSGTHDISGQPRYDYLDLFKTDHVLCRFARRLINGNSTPRVAKAINCLRKAKEMRKNTMGQFKLTDSAHKNHRLAYEAINHCIDDLLQLKKSGSSTVEWERTSVVAETAGASAIRSVPSGPTDGQGPSGPTGGQGRSGSAGTPFEFISAEFPSLPSSRAHQHQTGLPKPWGH